MFKNKARKESSIYNIRIFHNWVKRELIKQSCDYLRENYEKKELSLLDLSSGKSGDMAKHYDNGILRVIGLDIDSSSIDEAKKRYNELINDLKKKNVKNLPKYEFYVMDLSDENNLEKIKKIIGDNKFDIVSCQFAIHYFFKTELTLNTFMTIVSSYITNNGFFIGTTMNGNTIKELFKTKGDILKNDIYKITNTTEKKDAYIPYNNKYTVSLGKDTDTEHYFVGKVSDEYLVDINELKRVGDKFNLMFLGETEFKYWYNKFNKNILSNQEKEFSFMNFSFVFRQK